MELLKSVVGAGAAACITVTFIHPIDTVKTRLQLSGDGKTGARNYKALGIAGTVSVIAGEEGVTAFWKVGGTPCANVLLLLVVCRGIMTSVAGSGCNPSP
jgi:hypothetical protein